MPIIPDLEEANEEELIKTIAEAPKPISAHGHLCAPMYWPFGCGVLVLAPANVPEDTCAYCGR